MASPNTGVGTKTSVQEAINVSTGAQNAVNAWKWVQVTATGVVAGIGPGNIFGGIMTQAVGTTTTITVYDAGSAVAGSMIVPVTATATTNVAGATTGCVGSAVSTLAIQPNLCVGLMLQVGLYITVGGTGSPTFLVLYR